MSKMDSPELTEEDAKERIVKFFNDLFSPLDAKILIAFSEKMGIPELLMETYRQAVNDTRA